MRARGCSQNEIMRTVHAHRKSIKLWLTRYPAGATLPAPAEAPPPISAEQASSAKWMRRSGNSWKTISQSLGVGEYKIRMVVDPSYVARMHAHTDRQKEARKGAPPPPRRDDWERKLANLEGRPKTSDEILAAGRFYNPADRRAGR
jgi:hypothetical protein